MKNCTLANGNKTDILIESGKIKEVGKIDGEGIDLTGKVLLTGLVDLHVHFREPGMSHKEDWKTGSAAAAKGGYTKVFDMPNTNPATTTVEFLEEKRQFAKESMIKYGFHFGATRDNFEEFEKSGLKGLKIFMGSSTGNLLVDDESSLDKLFSKANFVMVHAENEDIIKENTEKYKGESDPFIHSQIRSNKAAEVAVKEAIALAEKNNTELYVCHASTKEEIDLIRDAKQRGVKVYCEVTPHHLFYDYNMLRVKGNFVKMNPPLRSPADVKALWEAIADGTIDTIGTDHAPHLKEEKEKEYWSAPAGVPGIENALALMLNAVNENRLTLIRVEELMSKNPSKIIGEPKDIKEGSDADFTVIDMNIVREVKDEDQVSKCKWSPYSGMTLKGWPVMTIINGQVVNDGKI